MLIFSVLARLQGEHCGLPIAFLLSSFPHRLLPLLHQFSCSIVSDSLQPHELQHSRLLCPSPTPGVHPNPCPSSRGCHPAISSSVVPFSSCPQSLPASGSFPVSQLFASGGQSTGVCITGNRLLDSLSDTDHADSTAPWTRSPDVQRGRLEGCSGGPWLTPSSLPCGSKGLACFLPSLFLLPLLSLSSLKRNLHLI